MNEKLPRSEKCMYAAARRLHLRTVKVVPYEGNTQTHEFSTGRKSVRCRMNEVSASLNISNVGDFSRS